MLEKTKEVLKDHASEYGVSEKVWKELKDVEKGVKILLELKVEYEANKHYIELGKAVEKAFKEGYTLTKNPNKFVSSEIKDVLHLFKWHELINIVEEDWFARMGRRERITNEYA